MMTGKSYIDNLDLFATYGIYVTSGGYNELISHPSLKPVTSNNWPEEDGLEFDLSDPVLDCKEFAISFAVTKAGSFNDFIMKLSDSGAYHTFIFNEIGKTYYLRLISQTSLKIDPDNKTFTFSLRFSDDFPLSNYIYDAPFSTYGTAQGYEFDYGDFADYGISILDGSQEEIQKLPEVKQNLFKKYAAQPGLLDDSELETSTYDDNFVVFKTKESTINCLLKAASLSEFWQNYNALIYDLIRPNTKTLMAPNITSAPFYYKNSSVKEFYNSGIVWCKFSLTIEFTTFRIIQ